LLDVDATKNVLNLKAINLSEIVFEKYFQSAKLMESFSSK